MMMITLTESHGTIGLLLGLRTLTFLVVRHFAALQNFPKFLFSLAPEQNFGGVGAIFPALLIKTRSHLVILNS
jgi:hypothetical protein